MAHGGTLPGTHGSQQSLVAEHPLAKNAMQGSVVVVGCAHRSAGPGQQVAEPAGSTHRHRCWHVPPTHWSELHPLPSSHSASPWHPGRVVVVDDAHTGLQSSFGFRHGCEASQGSSLHCMSTVTKQRPGGGGGGQPETHPWLGRQGCAAPQL